MLHLFASFGVSHLILRLSHLRSILATSFFPPFLSYFLCSEFLFKNLSAFRWVFSSLMPYPSFSSSLTTSFFVSVASSFLDAASLTDDLRLLHTFVSLNTSPFFSLCSSSFMCAVHVSLCVNLLELHTFASLDSPRFSLFFSLPSFLATYFLPSPKSLLSRVPLNTALSSSSLHFSLSHF